MDVTATVGDTTVDWQGGWVVTPDPLDVTTTQAITLTQALPGFALGDTGAPAVLTLHGEYGTCAGGAAGWSLSGAFAPAAGESFTFDGFAVSTVNASGCVDATGLQLDVTTSLAFGEGAGAVTVDLALHLDHGDWSLAGQAEVDTLAVGIVTIEDGTLTFTADHTGGTFGLSVAFTAATATVFDSVLTGVSGSIAGTAQLDLHADSIDAAVAGGLLLFDIPAVDLHVPGVDGVILAVDGDVIATAPHISVGEDDELTVTVSDLRIHDDGRFSATSVSVEQPAGIARAIGLGGLIPVDLTGLELVFPGVGPDDPVDDLAAHVHGRALGVAAARVDDHPVRVERSGPGGASASPAAGRSGRSRPAPASSGCAPVAGYRTPGPSWPACR